jgi:hypothetical protein
VAITVTASSGSSGGSQRPAANPAASLAWALLWLAGRGRSSTSANIVSTQLMSTR